MIGALKGKWWSIFCLTNLWQRTGLHSQLKISCWLEEGLNLSVTGIKLHKNLIRGVSLEKEGTQDLEILQCRLSAAFAYLVSVARSALQTDTYVLYTLKNPYVPKTVWAPWFNVPAVGKLLFSWFIGVIYTGVGQEKEEGRTGKGRAAFPPSLFSSVSLIFVIIM